MYFFLKNRYIIIINFSIFWSNKSFIHYNNFKNAYSNYQKSEAYDLAIKYGRNRIADATAEELQDPTWWNSVAEDLSKVANKTISKIDD